MRNFQMFKEYLSICSNCGSNTQKCITLDCRHPLCLKCLANLLIKNETSQMLTDQIEMICKICSYSTLISVPLAYKLTRALNLKHFHSDSSQSNKITMFCMECLDQPFTIEQYLAGKHKSHKIKTIQQATLLLTNILTYAAKDLEQSVDNLYRQEQKLGHCMNLMKDVILANVERIKLGFERLRIEINKREQQVILAYRIAVQNQFRIVQVDMQQLHKTIQKGKEQLQWIVQNVVNREEKEWKKEQKIKLTTYFAANFASLSAPHQLEELVKDKIPSYMQLVRINREAVSVHSIQPIVDQIRLIKFTEESECDQNQTEASSTLSRSYFQIKKKEILGEPAISFTPSISFIDKKKFADKSKKSRRQFCFFQDSAIPVNPNLH